MIIVVPVKHAIQYGLNHPHACDCDCCISGLNTLWICDINIHPIAGIWELHIISEMTQKLCLEYSLQMIEVKWYGLAEN